MPRQVPTRAEGRRARRPAAAAATRGVPRKGPQRRLPSARGAQPTAPQPTRPAPRFARRQSTHQPTAASGTARERAATQVGEEQPAQTAVGLTVATVEDAEAEPAEAEAAWRLALATAEGRQGGAVSGGEHQQGPEAAPWGNDRRMSAGSLPGTRSRPYPQVEMPTYHPTAEATNWGQRAEGQTTQEQEGTSLARQNED